MKWAGSVAAPLLAAIAIATTVRAQERAFVGQPGQVGAFESRDPVLVDEVMTGIIPSGQDWFLFGEQDRGGPYGGPRAPYNDGISNQQTTLGFAMIQKF